MSKTATDTKPAPRTPARRPARSECCDDSCTSGRRNRYFLGKRLTPDSFKVEQDYLVERRRLLNRAIHGWGVVYGYPVAMAPLDKHCPDAGAGRLEIGAGLALDKPGRELVQTGTLSLSVASATMLDKDGKPVQAARERVANVKVPPKDPNPLPTCWLLSVHYAERQIAPLPVKDPCSCERREWDQVCETVHYTLRQIECRDCCMPWPCELECGCATGPCCGEGVRRREPALARPEIAERLGGRLDDAREKPAAGAKPFRRGGCSCLCEHLTALHPGAECDRLCEIETECGPIRADLHNGVPLACVTLARNDCGDWIFDTVFDACGPRRLVKRNDLLFDLIRGCDLTRISAIGWTAWHRSGQTVAWKDFEESLRGKEPLEQMHPNRYWVEFSRPVRKETVLLDCFSMTVIVQDDDSGWDQVLRVPIAEVTTWAREGTPEDHVTHAGLIVEDAWFDDEADTTKQYGGRAHKHSVFYEEEALVEIEVRGDYIVDCNGQTVDANAAGLRAAPTGNGTPGGTFLSTFRVAPMVPR